MESTASVASAENATAGTVARSLRLPGALMPLLLLVLAGVLAGALPVFRNIDLALLDAQFRLLARHAPLSAPDSIAIVGVDEASLAELEEPQSLLHRPLARALSAIAAAGPRVIGVDIVLPDRSHDALLPGSDLALASALIGARKSAPVVLGITVREDGNVRPVSPALLAAAGRSGLALLPTDGDGRVRRFDDRLGEGGERVPLLAGEIARVLGLPIERGILQYALGSGYDYVPLAQVLRWERDGSSRELADAFRDRVVLIGAVLPFEDRIVQPVQLARGMSGNAVPGVMVHAQAIASIAAHALVQPAPWTAQLAMLASGALLWLVPRRGLRFAALAAFTLIAFALALLWLREGTALPLAASLTIAIVAAASRSAVEAWQARNDRARLRRQFGGYVSPAVLAAILDGRLDDDARHGRRTLAFLFADIRDFMGLTAAHAPEAVLSLLNRYYAAMTPVLHAHGGTIDNFRGDGIMAVFGAPQPLSNPARSACATARGLLGALHTFNRELAAQGHAPLAIGVTMAYGDAVVGNVGSSDRYNYTALGDGANVAARLQEAAKAAGYPIVATAALVEAAGETEGWVALGQVAVRGHAPVEAFGSFGGQSDDCRHAPSEYSTTPGRPRA